MTEKAGGETVKGEFRTRPDPMETSEPCWRCGEEPDLNEECRCDREYRAGAREREARRCVSLGCIKERRHGVHCTEHALGMELRP